VTEGLHQVFVGHSGPALLAAAACAVGLGLSVLLRGRAARLVAWPPLQTLRLVRRLLGTQPGLVRTALVIWLFNSAVMLGLLAGGVRPWLPLALAGWTALNVGLLSSSAQPRARRLLDVAPPPGAWRPPAGVALGCGAVVLLVEPVCLCYAVGLGVAMGRQVAGRDAAYAGELAWRASAYGRLIVPLLLAAAAAESVAVRAGARSSESRKGQDAGEEQPVRDSQ